MKHQPLPFIRLSTDHRELLTRLDQSSADEWRGAGSVCAKEREKKKKDKSCQLEQLPHEPLRVPKLFNCNANLD